MAWRAETPDAVARALRVLWSDAELMMAEWKLGDALSPIPFATTVDAKVEETPWLRDRIVSRFVDETWLTRDVNQAQRAGALARACPAGFRAFVRHMLRPLGFGSQLRVNLDDGSGRLWLCAFYRWMDSPNFEVRDRDLLQAMVPDLIPYIVLRRRFQIDKGDDGAVARVVEAMARPAFLTAHRGRLVYANSAARRAYDQPPGWLRRREALRRLPAWVQHIPLRLSGGVSLNLLVVDEPAAPRGMHTRLAGRAAGHSHRGTPESPSSSPPDSPTRRWRVSSA